MAPTKKYIKTGPGYPDAIQRSGGLGIVADVCIVRDVLAGSDCISIEDSQMIENYMLDGAGQYMEKKGYVVRSRLSPFVGAFKSSGMTFKTRDHKDADAVDQTPPFYVSDTMKEDKELNLALSTVIRRTLAALEQKSETPSEVFLRDDTIPEHLSSIAQKTDTDHLLVIVGNGRKVSGAKSCIEGCGTGALTLILSGGMFMVSAHDVSTFDTYMALVDLDTGKIEWSNSLRLEKGDPTERDYYIKRWSRTMLYHFPEKGGAG
jgi:hypothetical protein